MLEGPCEQDESSGNYLNTLNPEKQPGGGIVWPICHTSHGGICALEGVDEMTHTGRAVQQRDLEHRLMRGRSSRLTTATSTR